MLQSGFRRGLRFGNPLFVSVPFVPNDSFRLDDIVEACNFDHQLRDLWVSIVKYSKILTINVASMVSILQYSCCVLLTLVKEETKGNSAINATSYRRIYPGIERPTRHQPR